jgi:hypothetical protein
MTVLPLQWVLPRPWRRGAVTRPWRRAERRPYQDPFFADPSAVEDDSRRMRPDAGRAW